MKKIIYIDNKELDLNISDKLSDSLLRLNLKIGDSFEFFPFNHFGDEKTEYKENYQDKHGVFYIKDIKYTLIATWNENVKIKVEFFLVKKK